ncbi:MAG: M56 family metallopeptidase [Syntrophomonadaceae bacterium]
MPEASAPVLRGIEIHLVFATLVALAAWALTSSRRGSATVKYWIWVATSVNFVLPLGSILDRLWSPRITWLLPLRDLGMNAAGNRVAAAAVGAAWALGAALMGVRLLRRVRADVGARPGARPERRESDDPGIVLARGVPVRFDAEAGTPAVDGLLRPRISLPAGIERLLTGPELDAVLLHELTHARRRDNLIRLVHEIGVCAFWFHPLVWFAGSRLARYRELSCDEHVIRGARGEALVSALAKLANPAETLLLQAGASSFVADRVASLLSPRRSSPAASAVCAVLFGAVLLSAILASAFQSNLMHRAALGEFCPNLRAELAARAK